MKKRQTEKEEVKEESGKPKQVVNLAKCSFSWERLKEIKDNDVEFFAGDGFKRLRIIDIDERGKSIHMVCELGKITFPLKFKKLEEVHEKVHSGKVSLIPYEIDKVIPTWGNFVTGLLRYFSCDKS
jgi:hypothetical protein